MPGKRDAGKDTNDSEMTRCQRQGYDRRTETTRRSRCKKSVGAVTFTNGLVKASGVGVHGRAGGHFLGRENMKKRRAAFYSKHKKDDGYTGIRVVKGGGTL